MPQIDVTFPHAFGSESGDVEATQLDENFDAVAQARLTMGLRLLSASSTVVDPDDNYSRFLCSPVASMTLTLPTLNVTTGFGFWVNNLNTDSPPLTVTLIGTVTINGTPVNNPVIPGDATGGLVVWDGAIWTLYQQFP